MVCTRVCLLSGVWLAAACSAPQQPATDASHQHERVGTAIVLEPGTPEYAEFLEGLRQHIIASRELLVPIFDSGDVAQLTVEGKSVSVERIDELRAQHIAAILERDFPDDTVSPRWFRRRSEVGRIFLVMGTGSLLINVEPPGRLSFEPGSLGSE